MVLLIGFLIGFVLAWGVRCQEWKRKQWFIWIPRITRNHNGQRLVVWGFWRKRYGATP